jgi:hypothetical protein
MEEKTNQKKASVLGIERESDMGEVILSWLEGDPLNFEDDDFLYVQVIGNHLEIGKIEVKKLE